MKQALAVLIVVLAVAACASCGAGAPRARPPDAPDRAGAPTITSPRDLRSRAAEPCATLLTAEQRGRLGFDEPGEFRIGALQAPTCRWSDRVSDRRVSAAVIVSDDLLVGAYRNRPLPVFRPFDLDRAPGVDNMSAEDAIACTTIVGVADRQSLELNGYAGRTADGVREGDPCALNREVAREILSTLPPLR